MLCACYVRVTRGIKGYVTYYLACHVRLQLQNMAYHMRLGVQSIPECHHLRKYGWMGANGQTGGKKSQQYFCTDRIHFLWPV